MFTLFFKAFGLLGWQLNLLLFPFAQHLLLETGYRAEQLVAAHLWRRQHNTAVQEAVDSAEQVLPVVGEVGGLVELLQISGEEILYTMSNNNSIHGFEMFNICHITSINDYDIHT